MSSDGPGCCLRRQAKDLKTTAITIALEVSRGQAPDDATLLFN